MKKFFLAVAVFSLLLAGAAYADGLVVQKVLFADHIAGLGRYTPRADNFFLLGDPCEVYIETSGFATPLTLNTQDEYNVSLAVDVKVKLPQSGRRIAEQADLATLDTKLRSKLDSHYFAIGFDFAEWTPGNYVLEVGVRDNIGGQTISQDLPFTLAEPTPADIQEREARQQQQAEERQAAPE